MERLATGKQNANAGDRSSYVAMADTFRLDYVGTKAGIKGASVVMGYLETGMRTLDAASALLSRMQELAVLGSNDTNTAADALAIDAEAEALADEFHRLLSKAKYKGKDVFVDTANGEYVSIGGRDAEMKFGIAKIEYSNLYLHSYVSYAEEVLGTSGTDVQKTTAAENDLDDITTSVAGVAYTTQSAISDTETGNMTDSTTASAAGLTAGDVDFTATKSGAVTAGEIFKQLNQLRYATSEGLLAGTPDTNLLTAQIEAVQKKINTARVQAGSQYAALESAVAYTTDLTAQYELGFNVVNDVNFSMETAHLAKNQILQQAATAMLAQANSGQQGLLQLIQG
jgi:flagellin